MKKIIEMKNNKELQIDRNIKNLLRNLRKRILKVELLKQQKKKKRLYLIHLLSLLI